MIKQSRAKRQLNLRSRRRRYSLELSEAQAELVSRAVELYARLGLGQFPLVLDRFFSWKGKVSESERARPFLQALAAIKNGDPHSHPGIHSTGISDDYRICFDLYQVVRHRLAWDKDPNPRDSLIVDFRVPHRTSASEELGRITQIEREKKASHRAPKKAARS